MLPTSWRPVPASDQAIIGPAEDGGYVVPIKAVNASTLLLSMGLYDDWRFEEDFRTRSNCEVICYDGTVTKRFWQKYTFKALLRGDLGRALRYNQYKHFFSLPGVLHLQQMIGYAERGEISLTEILDSTEHTSIFLKMDIEGAEYRVLEDIVGNASRFTGVVIEFHDVDLHRDRITSFVKQMEGFLVTALHPNNWGGVDPNSDPVVLEMTLTSQDFIEKGASKCQPPTLPPSTLAKPDIILTFG